MIRSAALLGALLLASPAWSTPAKETPFDQIVRLLEVERLPNLVYLDKEGKVAPRADLARVYNAGGYVPKSWTINKGKPNVQSFLRLERDMSLGTAKPVVFKIKPGQAFPAFNLVRTDGVMSSTDALRGRYSLISFYAAYCGPCVNEVPQLNYLARKYPSINYLAMSSDTFAEAKQFIAQHQFEWATVPDANVVLKAIGLRGFPMFALLDPAGKLVRIGEREQFLGKAADMEELLMSLPKPAMQ